MHLLIIQSDEAICFNGLIGFQPFSLLDRIKLLFCFPVVEICLSCVSVLITEILYKRVNSRIWRLILLPFLFYISQFSLLLFYDILLFHFFLLIDFVFLLSLQFLGYEPIVGLCLLFPSLLCNGLLLFICLWPKESSRTIVKGFVRIIGRKFKLLPW
jgi:hypothetical protein